MNAELQAAYGQYEAARILLRQALEREAAKNADPVKKPGRTRLRCGPEAQRLAMEIAAEYGISVRWLMSADTHRAVAWPRQHLMAALYATGRYSLPAIGAFLGGRDHTTILHGIRAHARRMAAASEMQEAA